jgi:hypothetical protein
MGGACGCPGESESTEDKLVTVRTMLFCCRKLSAGAAGAIDYLSGRPADEVNRHSLKTPSFHSRRTFRSMSPRSGHGLVDRSRSKAGILDLTSDLGGLLSRSDQYDKWRLSARERWTFEPGCRSERFPDEESRCQSQSGRLTNRSAV